MEHKEHTPIDWSKAPKDKTDMENGKSNMSYMDKEIDFTDNRPIINEPSKSKIEVKSEGMRTQIFIDGHQIRGVQSFTAHQDLNGLPTLTLNLNALDMSLEGDIYNFFVDKMGEVKSVEFTDGKKWESKGENL
jgi:hypothetical protein